MFKTFRLLSFSKDLFNKIALLLNFRSSVHIQQFVSRILLSTGSLVISTQECDTDGPMQVETLASALQFSVVFYIFSPVLILSILSITNTVS